MKTFNVHRADGTRQPFKNVIEIKGVDFLDAVKNNFKTILDVSTYYHQPYEYPMTVTVVVPDLNAQRSSNDRISVKLELEWMHATHTNRAKEPHRHKAFVFVDDAADLPEATTFVVLGN